LWSLLPRGQGNRRLRAPCFRTDRSRTGRGSENSHPSGSVRQFLGSNTGDRSMNLFATVLTYPAPSANYRGENELNRSVIQKVTDGRFDYAIISPEAMRNALREILAGYGLECNRRRLP